MGAHHELERLGWVSGVRRIRTTDLRKRVCDSIMGSGKDFEDSLMTALEDWVGDEGVPMLRKQSMSMRRGSFQAAQELDIMCDSPHDKYYVGLEAKSRNGETRPGFYFSSDLNIEQIEDEIEYGERSGRDFAIAVEVRNYEEDDYDRTAWLVPPELFVHLHEEDEVKVSWEQVDQYGYCIGHDGDYEITRDAFDSVIDGEWKF